MLSLNRVLLYVTDPHKSADFYQKIGFEAEEVNGDFAVCKLNQMTLHLHNQKVTHFPADAETYNKGAGVFLYIQTDQIDKLYDKLKARGLKTSSIPRDYPWGHREFVIRDPNKYKVVFYQKLL